MRKKINFQLTNIYLFIFFVYFSNFLNYAGFVSKKFTWGIELILISMFLNLIFRRKKITIGYNNNKAILQLLIMLVSTAIMGIIINRVSPLVIISGVRFHFKYFILFFYILNLDFRNFKELEKNFFPIMLSIGLLQVVFNLYWYLTTKALPGDQYSGSFGLYGTGYLAYFVMFIFTYLFFLLVEKRINLIKGIFYILIILSSLIYSGTTIIVILLPFSIMGVLYYSGIRFNFFKIVLPILLIILLFLSVPTFNSQIYRAQGILSAFRTRDRHVIIASNASKRYYGLEVASTILNKNNLIKLFGIGIGNISQSFSKSTTGQYYNYYFAEGNKLLVPFTRIVVELGIVGLLIWLYFIVLVLKEKKFSRFYGVQVKVLTLLMFSSMFYIGFIFSDSMMAYYFIILSLGVRDSKIKERH